MMCKRVWFQIGALLVLFFFAGCASTVENNYLKPEDFASYLRREGIEVGPVRPVLPDPFRATSGCAIMVGNSEIGVYKYDQSSRLQRDRLANIAKAGRTYIQGIPYPVEVYGSFMVFGLEKNEKKHEIVRALKKFK